MDKWTGRLTVREIVSTGGNESFSFYYDAKSSPVYVQSSMQNYILFTQLNSNKIRRMSCNAFKLPKIIRLKTKEWKFNSIQMEIVTNIQIGKLTLWIHRHFSDFNNKFWFKSLVGIKLLCVWNNRRSFHCKVVYKSQLRLLIAKFIAGLFSLKFNYSWKLVFFFALLHNCRT